WTATFTPNANANDAANTISVNLAGVRDDAGNAGTGSASSANYSVDTVRPTATITLADSALTVDGLAVDAAARSGGGTGGSPFG
ncbi:Ig-like domain-containing protein, partial [Verminephrobacter aporrectodeae]|uniref:Ig-like domain-containing protein n=1 Tax=Verminephrobacter aporrectodeae TaxID=1110389 RepID=UPI0002377B0A